jgi:hypothetical protein
MLCQSMPDVEKCGRLTGNVEDRTGFGFGGAGDRQRVLVEMEG